MIACPIRCITIPILNILEMLTVRYNHGLKRACIFFISVFYVIKIRPQLFLLLMIQPLYVNCATKRSLQGLFFVCVIVLPFSSHSVQING